MTDAFLALGSNLGERGHQVLDLGRGLTVGAHLELVVTANLEQAGDPLQGPDNIVVAHHGDHLHPNLARRIPLGEQKSWRNFDANPKSEMKNLFASQSRERLASLSFPGR